ncbi:MAG: hypothetical protein IIB00_10685, partial [candidate division Zixibacteria bacterium]|nr:hypothetical protein [candidate division Zixibacteria bacterium]
FTAYSLSSINFSSSTATQAPKNSIRSNLRGGNNLNSPGSFASIGRSSKASNSIELKGTKRFAINTRNSSGATYDQSLDLEISGELTPGLFVSGALTDRSYDPSYGGVNGRISELDKLRLTFTSKKFMGEIGDLSLRDSRWNSPHRGKKLSGVATQIETGAVKSSITFGRPRGERESVSFTGQTGRQGPYKLRSKKISPIITPGSVEVWVDGARMDEGANKDFVVDYSFGEITFTPSRPIDSRSRIEVDFDPLESSYKKEYLSVSSVASSEGKSSQIEISFRREGDIKDQFQNVSNPGASQSALLFAGDDPQKAIISGVKPDSAGAYVYDLEGNLNYVGAGLGDFSVAFSPVGSANGDYIFLGGDHYEYAGAGQGDFLPIIHLVAPERRELFKLNARSTLGSKISYHVGGQFSSVDLNQISPLDDFDNKGGMYSIGLDFNQSANLLQQRTSGAKVSTSKIQTGWSGRVNFRMREANFATSERINTADFGRAFLIPSDFKRNSEEKLSDFSLSRSLGRHVRISTSARRLSYGQGFEANSGELSGLIKSETFESETRFVLTESDYIGESAKRYGKSRRFDHTSQLRVSRSVLFGVTVNHDNRQNNYSEALAGWRYNELIFSGTIHGLTAAISTRRDDTLDINWRSSFSRDRISIRGGMRYSFATMESQILFQRIGKKSATDNQRLVQTRWKFFPRVQKRDVVVSYKLSDEARSERALRFVRVTQGFGTHSLVDSVYLPDPDGDFIQLEENLSSSSAVKFGEKDFSWRERFSKGEIRVSSRVSEELLDLYSRDIGWFLPVFWSGADKLLRGDRVLSLDARLFPQIGGYGISVSASQRNRTRRIAEETRRKDERSISGTARQVSKDWRAEERL